MKYLEENFVSVVLVVQNEEQKIEQCLSQVFDLLHNTFKNYEVVIVDNASTDKTIQLAENIPYKFTVVKLARKHSVEMAIQAGIDIAIGDYIIEVPNIEEINDWCVISKLYYKSQEGYDFVFCIPKSKRISSKIFYKFINKTLGENCDSSIATISSRRGQNKIEAVGSKIVNRNIAYVMCGLSYSSIKDSSDYRNKRGLKRNIGLMLDSLIYYTDFIAKAMIGLAIAFFCVSLLLAIYTVVVKVIGGSTYGWASTVLIICFGFAGVFLLLGIISRYLDHILKNTLNTKNYIFSEIKK